MDEEKELTTEQKLAQSTGNDTDKFSKELEDEADELIKQAYGGDDKDDDKDDTAKEDKVKADDDGGKDDDKGSDEDNEEVIKIDPEITSLLDKLDKSEKRIKDTRADHTRGRQELKDEKTRNTELEDTVFKLKTQMEALQNAQTAKQEVRAEKIVEKTTGALADQIATMEQVDPEMAKAMKPIVESMFGQIDGLKEDLATEKENSRVKAIDDANDAHFGKIDKAHDGWEATMQTPEFAEYLQQLAPRAKRLAMLDLKGGSADNVIEVFDEFKEFQGGDDDGESDKIKLAKKLSNPTNRKSKSIDTGVRKMLFTRTQIDGMTDEEYAKNEDAIDQAMANGQIQQV
jgi:hypothetical protein